MKKTILCLSVFLGIALLSCKKYVQQQEQQAAISLITNGTWIVSLYKQAGTDITSSFSGYVFQFKSDGSVTGTKDSVSVTGTWAGDATNRTITSAFPAGSGVLNDLNGIWKITDSSLDYVVANSTVDSTTNNLKLIKN